ncbi:MAG TPA: hypothetical protein VK174_08125, partial [Chitinophagales bacterium]|nr:hypothetical protein [Chitinophagales bacterium]
VPVKLTFWPATTSEQNKASITYKFLIANFSIQTKNRIFRFVGLRIKRMLSTALKQKWNER